jgi:hypothetical protein
MSRPAQHKPSAEEDDRNLFDAVLEMKKTAPSVAQRHYIDTLDAIESHVPEERQAATGRSRARLTRIGECRK